MTRENKLALVLGFGLMLFVGILVSDHLAARKAPPLAGNLVRSKSGEVLAPFPSPTGRTDGVRLVRGDRQTLVPQEGVEPEGQVERVPEPQAREPHRQVDSTPSGQPPQAPPAVRTYVVREGDTFAAIASREYGRGALGEPLAKHNDISPRALRVGATIRLPPIEALDGTVVAAANAAASTPASGPASGHRTVTVQQGDNLYRIARRELGEAGRWEELKAFNQDVLKGKSDLVPGMQLRIPVESGTG